ncbi:TauD/TfdA-like domain [Phytophthora cactorum]|nr:TauD/TfdA-like domain [Phytophthora cactorum]
MNTSVVDCQKRLCPLRYLPRQPLSDPQASSQSASTRRLRVSGSFKRQAVRRSITPEFAKKVQSRSQVPVSRRNMRLQAIRPLRSLLHSKTTVSSALRPWARVDLHLRWSTSKWRASESLKWRNWPASRPCASRSRMAPPPSFTSSGYAITAAASTACTRRRSSASWTQPPSPWTRHSTARGHGRWRAVAIDWDAPVRGTPCTASEFDAQWLRDHAYALEGGNAEDEDTAPYPKSYRQPRLTTQQLWAGADFQLPTHDYNKCVDNIEPLMRDLYTYGLVRVSDTPNSMEATEKFSKKIGFVLRTIYGTMWTTNPTNDAEEYNDTASTNLELLHHTDGTYIRDPPGLQIFNCAAQAGEGGESRYVDSFHVVETLRKENPEAFRVLSTTPLPYFTVDNDAHLATMEPLIRVDYAGNVVQFRHNDYDRAPLTHLNFEEVGEFYKAHRKLLEVLRRTETEFCMRLQVGDMMIVDNQRVMHGRHAFQGGDRALIGCYIGRTEFESRLRVLGII